MLNSHFMHFLMYFTKKTINDFHVLIGNYNFNEEK